MALITLKNNFHNTTATIRCEVLSHIYGEVEIVPSKKQLKRVRNDLCGIEDCECGGIRGVQEFNGKRLIVDTTSEFCN